MEENPVEQIAAVTEVTFVGSVFPSLICSKIEEVYQALYAKAKARDKVIIGVSQTITPLNNTYIIALVGSAVDAQLVEQQKRLQQFGMGNVHPKPRGVN